MSRTVSPRRWPKKARNASGISIGLKKPQPNSSANRGDDSSCAVDATRTHGSEATTIWVAMSASRSSRAICDSAPVVTTTDVAATPGMAATFGTGLGTTITRCA